MTTPLAVEAHGLVKTFGDQRAVDGLDLEVTAGTVYGVLGPNGAGKTTTIRMLATLLRLDGGSARIFGHDVVAEPQVVRQLIGVTGQYASVDETLSATENLTIFARLLGYSAGAAKKPLQNFSGGMRRRLDLAASLLASPPLIFLDEPTTGLDPRTRLQMWETVRRLVREGSTVVLTTQYLDEADQLAHRIAVIDSGRVVAEGTADDLKASVGTSSFDLILRDEEQVVDAASRLARVLGSTATVSPGGRLTAPLADADRVADLLIELRAADIHLAEFSVRKPTLDEVFLTLTGHGVDDVAEQNQEVAA